MHEELNAARHEDQNIVGEAQNKGVLPSGARDGKRCERDGGSKKKCLV
jgi:hypothetical protein